MTSISLIFLKSHRNEYCFRDEKTWPRNQQCTAVTGLWCWIKETNGDEEIVSMLMSGKLWEIMTYLLSFCVYMMLKFNTYQEVRFVFYVDPFGHILFVCLFVWGFRPTQEFFTHMETSPLPVKVCKF